MRLDTFISPPAGSAGSASSARTAPGRLDIADQFLQAASETNDPALQLRLMGDAEALLQAGGHHAAHHGATGGLPVLPPAGHAGDGSPHATPDGATAEQKMAHRIDRLLAGQHGFMADIARNTLDEIAAADAPTMAR